MPLIYKYIAVAVLGAFVGSGLTFVIVNRTSVTVGAATTNAPPDSGFQAKTYQYYKAHPGEANRRYAECTNTGVSGMADTPESRDCQVARSARD
ncbi:hypothetical protein [Caballeronia sordidicola]|uniref:hypothetical protein n=1 Tax=Caballeronia sordidicola TaxID=196367 RepID=UPI00094D800B|nr:hypothetical protein [Caballeronia sordidicola]